MPDLQYSSPDWDLKLHRREVFHVHRLPLAIESHDQRQSDGHFRCRYSNDEKDHHLPVKIVVEPGERHQRQVASVKHELERHVNHEQVPPDDDSQQSQQKKPGAHEQNMLQRHVSHSRCLLLNNTVPIIATRSRTETISNGSRYWENSSSPSRCVPPASPGIGGGRRSFPLRNVRAHTAVVAATERWPVIRRSFPVRRRPSSFKLSSMITKRKSTITAPA